MIENTKTLTHGTIMNMKNRTRKRGNALILKPNFLRRYTSTEKPCTMYAIVSASATLNTTYPGNLGNEDKKLEYMATAQKAKNAQMNLESTSRRPILSSQSLSFECNTVS